MTFLLLVTLTSMLLAVDHERRRVAHRRRGAPPVGGARRGAGGGHPRRADRGTMRGAGARASRGHRRRAEPAHLHRSRARRRGRRVTTSSNCDRRRRAAACSRHRSRRRRDRDGLSSSGSARWRFAAAAALAIVSSAGAAERRARPARGARSPRRAGARPLELVALGHERDGDRLTVRGVVRNPAAGAAMDGLTAVVVPVQPRRRLPDQRPRASRSADARARAANRRSSSRVPGAADVGRYRVSFRTDDRIVPHVDRREPQHQT